MQKIEGFSEEPWEIEYTENGIETNVCGPIKARYQHDHEAMRVEAEANAALIIAAPELYEENQQLEAGLRALEKEVGMETDHIDMILDNTNWGNWNDDLKLRLESMRDQFDKALTAAESLLDEGEE